MSRKKPAAQASVVVSCGKKRHKVRLDPRRFWAPARCPICKTPVDRSRLRRVAAVVRLIYRFSAETPGQRRILWISWAYMIGVIAAWVGMWQLGDRWAPATVLLFGPRWLVVLPVAVLLPVAAVVRRRLVVPLVVTTIIALGPIMGLRVGWRGWLNGDDPEGTIRVVTFNAEGGLALGTALHRVLLALRADIVAFQECGSELVDEIALLPDTTWHRRSQDHLCLVSRFPIDTVDHMDRENLELAGGSGLVIRYAIELPDQVIQLTNLHLDTPREGLDPLLAGRIFESLRILRAKSMLRDIESRVARRWAEAEDGAFLIMGDFNMPAEGVIYREHWGDLRNAFSYVGSGFGSTRITRWVRARIDHILVGDGWRVRRAFVGPDLASDHRPMVADLVPPER